MLVLSDQYADVYNKIKENAMKFHPHMSVVIFVAANADAVCSCRILQLLLQSDFITYKLVPVNGYGDILASWQELLVDNEHIRSVIMLNCGGNLDISVKLHNMEINLERIDVDVYVIDSSRPIDLSNIYGLENQEQSVSLFVDEKTRDDKSLPTEEEFRDADQGNNEDGSDSSDFSSSESEFDDDDDDNDDDDDDNEDDDDDDDDDLDKENVDSNKPKKKSGAKKRSRNDLDDESESFSLEERRLERSQRRTQERLQRRAERRERRIAATQKVMEYSVGSYYGMASTTILYLLARSLNKENNSLLWLGIVGLTEQKVYDYIDKDTYMEYLIPLQQEVSRLNNSEEDSANANTNHVEEGSVIRFGNELQFVAVRHWTLYDSMINSRYVATRLGTWRDIGITALNTLLVKMGLSLQQCKEKYSFMNSALKLKLKEQLVKHGEYFNLRDPLFPSFHRILPHQTALSASDFVFCINALLNDPLHNQDSGFDLSSRDWIRENFFRALDALSEKRPALLFKGLDLTMEQHKFILEQVSAITEQRGINHARSLSHAFITNQHPMLSSPFILINIALFLLDLLRASGKEVKPFVLCAQQMNSDTTLVVGVTGVSRFGETSKNTFGLFFRKSAESTNGEYKHDSNSKAVIEIRTMHIQHFLQTLISLYDQE